MINFCLFCLFTKEVRIATINAVRKLCHCQPDSGITAMPEVSWITQGTSSTGSTLFYGAINSQENDYENPIEPSTKLN